MVGWLPPLFVATSLHPEKSSGISRGQCLLPQLDLNYFFLAEIIQIGKIILKFQASNIFNIAPFSSNYNNIFGPLSLRALFSL
jgi:hypothetical protein